MSKAKPTDTAVAVLLAMQLDSNKNKYPVIYTNKPLVNKYIFFSTLIKKMPSLLEGSLHEFGDSEIAFMQDAFSHLETPSKTKLGKIKKQIQVTYEQRLKWIKEASGPVVRLKLYKFVHLTKANENILVISSLPPDHIRDYVDNWDHGGMDYETYHATLTKGTCQEVTSLDEFKNSPYDQDNYNHPYYWVPYCTDERINCDELGGTYLDLDIDILEYFENYYGKEFNKKK